MTRNNNKDKVDKVVNFFLSLNWLISMILVHCNAAMSKRQGILTVSFLFVDDMYYRFITGEYEEAQWHEIINHENVSRVRIEVG